MTDEPLQIPVFVVTGANWTMEVPLDEFNTQFDIEAQTLESATRAMESLENQREDCRCVMNPDSRGEKPEVGTTVLVHPKGVNPDEAAIIFTHVCFANMGMYESSVRLSKLLDIQIAEIRKQQQEREQAEKNLAETLKQATLLTPKKTRKPRKKNPPNPPSPPAA